MTRGRLVAAVSLLAMAMVGCATQVAGEPSVPPTATVSTSPEVSATKLPPRQAPPVRDPRDARGVDACSLLTSAQLIELGFRPDTAQPGTSGSAQVCGWRSTDSGNAGGLQISIDSAIAALDGIYLIRDTFAVFEPIEIAGHPAVHADGNAGPVCTIYTAIADYQGVSTDGNLAGRPLPDPCAPSRRMAEMILSNLPPLR